MASAIKQFDALLPEGSSTKQSWENASFETQMQVIRIGDATWTYLNPIPPAMVQKVFEQPAADRPFELIIHLTRCGRN